MKTIIRTMSNYSFQRFSWNQYFEILCLKNSIYRASRNRLSLKHMFKHDFEIPVLKKRGHHVFKRIRRYNLTRLTVVLETLKCSCWCWCCCPCWCFGVAAVVAACVAAAVVVAETQSLQKYGFGAMTSVIFLYVSNIKTNIAEKLWGPILALNVYVLSFCISSFWNHLWIYSLDFLP